MGQAQVEALGEIVRQQGYRWTATRAAIADALLASEGHITADKLVDLVREKMPKIGRMTVYRTLELLTELGVLRPVYQGTGAAHYVVLEQGHHHHLVCSRCDLVIEFERCRVDEMSAALAERFGFEIQGHLLEIFGLCAGCQDEV